MVLHPAARTPQHIIVVQPVVVKVAATRGGGCRHTAVLVRRSAPSPSNVSAVVLAVVTVVVTAVVLVVLLPPSAAPAAVAPTADPVVRVVGAVEVVGVGGVVGVARGTDMAL